MVSHQDALINVESHQDGLIGVEFHQNDLLFEWSLIMIVSSGGLIGVVSLLRVVFSGWSVIGDSTTPKESKDQVFKQNQNMYC